MNKFKGFANYIIFYFLELICLISILLIMFSADYEGEFSDALKFVGVVAVIGLVSGVAASIMDDPNKVIRHFIAITSCLVAAYGAVFNTSSDYAITMYKAYLRCGSFSELYKQCLHSWDVTTYDKPTSKYFNGLHSPRYDRYYLKDEFDKIETKRSERYKSYDLKEANRCH